MIIFLLLLLLIFAALLAIYWPILTTLDPILLDVPDLLEPLLGVHSLSHYWQLVQSGTLVDVQPIRDLSFLFDLWVLRQSGVSIFLAHNFCLLLLAATLIFLILYQLRPCLRPSAQWLPFGALWLMHPLLIPSVAVMTNRKHLLAMVWILLATYLVVKAKEQALKQFWHVLGITLCYLLALLSNPIHLLWPVAIGTYVRLKLPHAWRWRTFWPLGLTALVCGLLNFFYYQQTSVTLAPHIWQESLNVGDKVLALGRYAFQVGVPIAYSLWPAKGAWFNFAGIPVLVVGFAWLWKRMARPIFWLWLPLILAPLVMGLLRTGDNFISNVYLLVPWCGLVIMVAHQGVVSGKQTLILWLLVVLLAIRAQSEAQNWASQERIQRLTLQREPTCMMAIVVAHQDLLRNQGKMPIYLQEYLKTNRCIASCNGIDQSKCYILKTLMIYYDPRASIAQKEGQLRRLAAVTFHAVIVQAVLTRNEEILHQIFLHPPVKWAYARQDPLILQSKPLCQKRRHQRCLDILDYIEHAPTTLFYDPTLEAYLKNRAAARGVVRH